MEKTTWIYFIPNPETDEIASKEEKVEALKKCLKESIPNLRIKSVISYHREEPINGLKPIKGLIFITDRIDGIVTARYEKKCEGIYSHMYDVTSDSMHESSEGLNEVKLPEMISYELYLPEVKALKLKEKRRSEEALLNAIMALLDEKRLIPYSSLAKKLGISENSLAKYVGYLTSSKRIIRGYAFHPRSYESIEIVALPELKRSQKIKKYEYVYWED